jgi:pimeloyl-ACP methyl ester carboxylesterase
MWGTEGFVGQRYDAAAVWKSYATNVSTRAVTGSGHFLPEEKPAATAAALTQFLE